MWESAESSDAERHPAPATRRRRPIGGKDVDDGEHQTDKLSRIDTHTIWGVRSVLKMRIWGVPPAGGPLL